MTPTEMFNFYRASKLASSNFPEDVTRAIQWEVAVKREAWALRRGRNVSFFYGTCTHVRLLVLAEVYRYFKQTRGKQGDRMAHTPALMWALAVVGNSTPNTSLGEREQQAITLMCQSRCRALRREHPGFMQYKTMVAFLIRRHGSGVSSIMGMRDNLRTPLQLVEL